LLIILKIYVKHTHFKNKYQFNRPTRVGRKTINLCLSMLRMQVSGTFCLFGDFSIS
jgi:hypothetical protein